MLPTQKFDLVSRSAIVRSEKPGKGLEGVLAPNPHQMNRLTGYLMDGKKVVIAQRQGKGGMEFNKLLSGKVYAVAADSLSPVFEKGADNKPTKTQKTEDGLPLYSSSGFYLMSSKEYPALLMCGAFTSINADGTLIRMVTVDQLRARQQFSLESELDWDLVTEAVRALLSDEHNLVTQYDAESNKKRKRALEREKEDAEGEGEAFEGPEFKELKVSKKDGNPFVLLSWKTSDGRVFSHIVSRDTEKKGADDRSLTMFLSQDEAFEQFKQSPLYRQLEESAAKGRGVKLALVQGHTMRSSVSFKKKVENALAIPEGKPVYGDAVYLLSSMKGWTKGLVSLLHTVHPGFPKADYDSLHYVAMCRQAEIGMNKKQAGGWEPPSATHYDLSSLALA
jgi:hypothetical protein